MSSAPPLRYRIHPRDPAAHLFEVRCTVADPDPAGQTFSLPAWTPGSYTIRDFARHVIALHANAGAAAVGTEKIDKDTWRCAPVPGPLTVTCLVYAKDLSVRAAHLDGTHGFFNGTSVFPLPAGRARRTCELEIAAPAGAALAHWQVATAMHPVAVDAKGFGRYRAADYEELVDHPVEMGSFERVRFEVCGVPHEMVLSGRQRADTGRLAADLRQLCEHHVRFFGEPPPMDRYLFLTRVVGEGYGGLEHRASCSLLCSRDDLPRPEDTGLRPEYRGFLGLCSHEYFHAWNVKRIRPAAFVPCDLSRERYTRLLWAFEGITSYYDDLALLRSGLVDAASYLELLGQTVTRVLRGPGRGKQSVAESSFDAWTRFYKPDENSPNALVSYYAKGSLIALALDLTIRRDTAGARSLDDVMRALWQRYGRGGEGVPEDGVEQVAAEISGLDLRPFFDAAVRGTGDLPLADLLADFGVRLRLRPAQSQDDKGGKPAEKEDAPPRAVLGVRFESSDAEPRLAVVYDGGAARAAGLAAGDLVAAIDGLRATRAGIERQIAAYPPGTTVRVHAFRRDELMEFELTLQPAPADTCFLAPAEEVSDPVRTRREAWLGAVPAAGVSGTPGA